MNVEQALGVFERALVACEQDGRSRVVRDGLDHEVWVASDMDGIPMARTQRGPRRSNCEHR